MGRAWFLGVALVWALSGCGDDGGGGNGDDGDDDGDDDDSQVDAGGDAGRDAGADAGGMDAGRDAGIDAGRDAGPADAGDGGGVVDAGRDGGVDAGGTPDAGPVSFATVYNTILAPKCSSANCHGGNNPQANMDFSSENNAYDDLVGEEADGPACGDMNLDRVVADQPDMSLLVKKVERMQPCGMPMPPSGALPANEVALIRAWIAQGAEED